MDEGKEALLQALEPVLDFLDTVNLGSPSLVELLTDQFPVEGDVVSAIRAASEAGLAAGWLCDRAAGGARFSRVAKASPETFGLSVDAVLSGGPGVEHTHPRGEVNLCLVMDGAPRFDGHGEGWAVYEPGSRHRPDVEGGTMLLLYLLPGGAIEWHR